MLPDDELLVMFGELRKGQKNLEKESDRLRNEISHLQKWLFVLSALLALAIFSNPLLRNLLPALFAAP
jgi:hypothetical protein